MTQRLAALIRAANPASFIITRMEVPCCGIPELLAAADARRIGYSRERGHAGSLRQ